MKAMILAAGEGRRMRPLTLSTPKPLLEVAGRTLLEYHLLNLKSAGFKNIVVNAAYHAEQIVEFCGDGTQWGLSIQVSVEEEPLETAGGIIKALPLLGDSPFLVLNGDTWLPYPFKTLARVTPPLGGAHLVLVDNPPHNLDGDFSLLHGKVVSKAAAAKTFSGLAVYEPSIFASHSTGKQPLKPVLERAILEGAVTGEHWLGDWRDIGTPERLAALEAKLGNQVSPN